MKGEWSIEKKDWRIALEIDSAFSQAVIIDIMFSAV